MITYMGFPLAKTFRSNDTAMFFHVHADKDFKEQMEYKVWTKVKYGTKNNIVGRVKASMKLQIRGHLLDGDDWW